jgi:hypothetical protein
MSDPSGSLNATRRAAPFRAIDADSVGIPTAFSPSVSALKVRVARYCSGSRAVIPASVSGALLALVFVFAVEAAVLVFAVVVLVFVLTLLFAGVQLLESEIRITATGK